MVNKLKSLLFVTLTPLWTYVHRVKDTAFTAAIILIF